ncbi:PREDICTED: leucine-rich repeat and transmembrane domain-containing protein 1-like [Nicrophorus vespilloides]|uniref:Leucine-rich repeat and transmembrane domain-containing protein 1-like n=1 Tax=Nicrophorus vespilloides TaxID=110193 RepID=A0ABM1M8P8_NICVS|nr:PREDICTED: leucine-rich repeat and transmembrane domain-containing protein 1-like [Nicrophorus vespilloides]
MNIRCLKLVNNSISNIGRNAFCGMKLQVLDLSFNAISDISLSVICRSKITIGQDDRGIPEYLSERLHVQLPNSLQYLNLSHNAITNIYQYSFMHAISLINLDLSHNNIDTLNFGWDKHLRYLEILDLSNNRLVSFDFGTFTSLVSLRHLNLTSNNLYYFASNIFITTRNLNILDLSRNRIRMIDETALKKYIPTLIYLNVSDNNWDCKSLQNLILSSLDRFEVVEHDNYNRMNVKGIACLDYK